MYDTHVYFPYALVLSRRGQGIMHCCCEEFLANLCYQILSRHIRISDASWSSMFSSLRHAEVLI